MRQFLRLLPFTKLTRLNALVTLVALFSIGYVNAQAPTFTSAVATSTTTINVTFNSTPTLTAIPGGASGFTITGVTINGASLAGNVVTLTVNDLGTTNFTCTNCLDIASGTVTNGTTNNVINNQDVTDGIPPSVTIGAPSASIANGSSTITYTITYTGASSVTLANANVTLNKTSTADASSVVVSGAGTTTRTVTITGISGNGTLGISLASGTATDGTNLAAAAGPSATFTVDTQVPSTPAAPDLIAGSDSGSSNTDNITNDNTPTFSVTAEAGTTITLFSGATNVGTMTATGGADNITASTLSDGTQTITITATDAAGNVSTASSGLSITIDTSAPAAPSTPDLIAGSDSGSSNSDNITNDNTPTFSITAANGSTITIFSGATNVGSITATAGPDDITASTLSDGTQSITATATDAAGNVSPASAGLSITVDTSAPTAPSTPDLAAASDSNINTDNVTNDDTPTFDGTATAGETVEIRNSGSTIGSAVAAGGNYTITTSSIADGSHSITARIIDVAGNVGESAALSVTIDKTAPSAPTTPDLAAGSDSGSSNTDNITNDNTPTFSVTAESGTTITLFSGATNVGTLTATAGPDNITASALSDGTSTITITATDLAGNVSTASGGLSVTIDTSAPSAPSTPDLIAGSDSGSSNSDNITNDNTPTFSITAANGSTITIFSGATNVGSITATAGPDNITASTLSDGTQSITATATDAAGNVSPASAGLSITVDTSAPTAPSTPDLAAASDSNINTDNVTNDDTPTFDGTATAGETVEIRNSGSTIGSAVAAGGNYSITTSSIADGTHSITARIIDVAGNVGESAALSVTIDKTAPSAPTTPDLAAGSDSGSSNTDNITNDNTPTFSVTAQSGTTITLFSGATNVGALTATAGPDNITASALSDGTSTITATATDLAGNVSTASGGLSVTIDTSAPATPSTPDLIAGSDSGSSNSDNITNDNTPTFSITAANGSTITIFSGATNVGSITATAGPDNITASALSNGTQSITATATDVAGNVSAASGGLSITVDTSAPAAPSTPDLIASSDSNINTDNTTNDNTPTFSITAENGSTVTFYRAAINIGTITATVGPDNFTPSTIADGTHTITATATDVAGNVSSASAGLSITIDTAAPATPGTPNLTAATDTFGGATGATGSNTDNITKHNTPQFTGTGVVGTTVSLYNGATNLGTSSTLASTTYTVNVSTLTVDGTYSITAKAMDLAGNESGASASLSVTIDRTPPTISGSPVFSANGNGSETVVLSFSETIDMGNNQTVANNTSAQTTNDGFYPSAGDIKDSGSKYASATNKVTLQSVSDGQWSSLTTFTYNNTSTGTANAAGGHPNYIYDIAGNELANTTFSGSDAEPPKLASGFIFNPDGSNPDKVIVRVDEELNLAEGATVTGFSLTIGGFAVTPTSVIYSGKGSTNTITFTASGDVWSDDILISYSQISGNVLDLTGINELVGFTDAAIRFKDVNISTNNANGFTSKAKTADVITVNFTTTTTLSGTPIVTVGGQSASVSGGPIYTATVAASALMPEGSALALTIIGKTANDSTNTSYTTDGTQVVYDKTSPTFSSATISSNNANATDRAKPGNTITLNFTINESALVNLPTTPTVTIAGRSATVTETDLVNHDDFTATLLLDGTETEGTIPFTINVQDQVGNTSSRSTTTNASKVQFNKTAPTANWITRLSANPNNTGSVQFKVVFSDSLNAAEVTTADFAAYGTASTGTSISNVTQVSDTTFTVTISNITATGNVGLTVLDDNLIEDLFDIPMSGDVNSVATYSIILPEPANHVTNFVASASSNTSITLSWNDVVSYPVPGGYVITIARAGQTANVPVDGNDLTVNTDLIADSLGYFYVGAGVQTATFTLLSGEDYVFKIYPYTNAGIYRDYKIDGTVPTVNFSAGVGNNTFYNISYEADVIRSTTTTLGSASANLQFYIYDDAYGFAIDNAPTKINTIIVNRNTANDQIGNWSDVLSQAVLCNICNGTDDKTGVIDPSGDFITFSNLYSPNVNPLLGEYFGQVPDNGVKYYTLKLVLKNNLGATLQPIIDNKSFVFEFTTASFPLAAGSSTIRYYLSGGTDVPFITTVGKNKVDVKATQLTIETQATTQQYVFNPVTPAIVVNAKDVNDNLDLDFSGTLDISNTATIPMFNGATTLSTISMVNGVATFPTNFNFGHSGSGVKLNISTTQPNAETPTPAVPTSVQTDAVDIDYSATSTIVTGDTPSPAEIIASNLNWTQVFDFKVVDNGGVSQDVAPTRITGLKITKLNPGTDNEITDWSQVIESAALVSGFDFIMSPANAKISADSITFYNIDPLTLGNVAANQFKNFQVWIRLKSSLGGTYPTTIDNLNFGFEVLDDHIVTDQYSSTFTGTENENSGAGNLEVEVVAEKLVFTTQPPSTQEVTPRDVLVNANLVQIPVVEALDNNGNRDLDYSPGTGITVTNANGLGMTNVPTSFTNGVLTFPSNFQYTQIGNGTLTLSSSTIAESATTAPTPVTSDNVNVRVAKSSTITAVAGGEPLFISSLATNGAGTAVFNFQINDDAGSENDGNKTQLNSLYITYGVGDELKDDHWDQVIDSATLSDGVNTVSVPSSGSINQDNIYFDLTSVAGQALGNIPNDGSKVFTLRIWLKETIAVTIDQKNFVFDIQEANIVTDVNGSSIIDNETTNSNVAGTFNEIEVDATKLRIDAPASGSINVALTPQVKLNAVDANNNLDLEFTGGITVFTNDDPANFQMQVNGTNDATTDLVGQTFAAGVYTIPSDFKFISTDPVDPFVKLQVTAGGISNVLSETSAIEIISSKESKLLYNNAYPVTARIPYIDHSATPFMIAGFTLQDGNGISNDLDGANTDIKTIKVNITTDGVAGSNAINTIGLYDENGTLIKLGTLTAGEATFDAMATLVALDNQSKIFTIGVTFNQTAAEIIDLQVLQAQLTYVELNNGSELNTAVGSVAAGDWNRTTFAVTNSPITPNTQNIIDVVATSLDFTTQPISVSNPKVAGIKQPIGDLPVIEARDANDIVDLDYDQSNPILSYRGLVLSTPSGGAELSSNIFAFTNGVATPNFYYTKVGDGTLTATAGPGSITSNVKATYDCDHIDVIHVYAVPSSYENLVTGSVFSGEQSGKAVFGITFKHDYSTSTAPYLNGFKIQFINSDGIASYNNAFLNPTVVESTNNDVYESGIDVPLSISEVIEDINKEFITVNFSSARALTSSTPSRTYFLIVDISPIADVSTPHLQPIVKDALYGANTGLFNEGNVLISAGSDSVNVEGVEYSFDTNSPPELIGSYPAAGQTNISINQTTISLKFNRKVFTLDGKAELYKTKAVGVDGVKVADLFAQNGLTTPTDSIVFGGVPVLDPDSLYYVIVKPINRDLLVGIIDEGRNTGFPGITYPGTVYFKTTDNKPLTLLSSPAPSISQIMTNGVVFNGRFDREGKAFYLVLKQNAAKPTPDQIKGNTPYLVTADSVTSGVISVNKVTPISQFGVITGLTANTSYEVYVYGEAYSEKDGNTTPIANTSFYDQGVNFSATPSGSPSFTFSFTTLSTPHPDSLTVNSNFPKYQLCVNSYQVISSPLIISEGQNKSEFQAVGESTFNILLPSGFEFDQSYPGQIVLGGDDFEANSGVLSFKNNSILSVKYKNTGINTYDFIAISNLRIKATSNTSGVITRLGGNAFTSSISDFEGIGTLSTYRNQVVDFTNSFAEREFPGWEVTYGEGVVTYIPDNYTHPDETQGTIKLVPEPAIGDYGPNSFSGTGVNNNLLNLSTPSLGVPFNITLTHIDQNGCITDNTQQYLVYDHTKGIEKLQTEYCFKNEDGIQTEADSIKIGYSDLANYYLIDLKVDIASNYSLETPITMNATYWQPYLQNWAQEFIIDPTLVTNNANPLYTVKSYSLGMQYIINAPSPSAAYPTARDYFRSDIVNGELTGKGIPYYRGGLLGEVELTAVYQSLRNSQFQQARKHRFNIYLPAEPIVESYGASGNANGVDVYCNAGGAINITGYPRSLETGDVGKFTITKKDDSPLTAMDGVPSLNAIFTDNGNGTAVLNPANITYYDSIKITYEYKANGSPCSSTGVLYIKISPNPVADFTNGNQCVDTDLVFTDTSTPNSGEFAVASWDWNFGDLGSTNNTSTSQTTSHNYTTPGDYIVSLSVENIYGCPSVSPAQSTLYINSNPTAAFEFSGVKVNTDFTFDASGSQTDTQDTFENFIWDFGDGNTITTNTEINVHAYSFPMTASVKLIIETLAGCIDSVKTGIVVLPAWGPTTTDSVYLQTFSDANNGWVAFKYDADNFDASSTSWNYNATDQVWTTENSIVIDKERSALYSPVFDLTDFVRPILTFRDSVNFETGDGLVLEYSTDSLNIADPRKKWRRLGAGATAIAPETGIGWYNSSNLPGKPGQQESFDYGWTEQIPWQESKHSLSGLLPTSVAKENVVFRFAVGSARSEIKTSGFTLDSVRLGNGTRTVLLESFSNTNVTFPNYNDFVNFNSSELGLSILKIDYHVGFPEADPFNDENPTDPGARALYYNISQTPQVILDGITNIEAKTTNWGVNEFNKRVLDLANASIKATVTEIDGGIQVTGSFTPLEEFSQNTILHVAVIERYVPLNDNQDKLGGRITNGIQDFHYVLRKLLPSASGTKFTPAQLTAGVTQTFGNNGEYTWISPSLFNPTDDISVVVFLQDEQSKRIYQSIVVNLASDPAPNVGVIDPEFAFGVFPNPADDQLTIELPNAVKVKTDVFMYDQLGNRVRTSAFEKGENQKSISTSNLAAGVYVVHVNTAEGAVRRKVMVVHQH